MRKSDTIGILEDSAASVAVYRSMLDRAGYTYFVEESVRAFIARCESESFDLVVLDWELPDGTAAEVIRWLRSQGRQPLPIIVASHHTEEDLVVEALQLGADDFIFKPVRINEMLARLEAHLRKSDRRGESIEIGPCVVDLKRRQVVAGGTVIAMTEREFDLLECLLLNRGQLLSRNKLLSDVWGVYADVDTRTVDVHVSRIRRKLRLEEGQPWTLLTVYGHGYRLIGPGDR